MTMIAYTRTGVRSRDVESPQTKRYGGIVRSRASTMPMGHIPQTGTRETLCGKPMYQQVDVPEGSEVQICKVCQRRLQSTILKFPGSELVRSLLGNNLLPAPEY